MQKTEYRKSESSRQQVIDAAIKTIATRGYAQTSVSDIAEAAGMSKGVVHYHFKSKDDLVGRVLDACCAKITLRTRAAWETNGQPIEKIRCFLGEMWATRTDGNLEMRVITELTAHGVHDAKLRSALTIMFQTARQQMADEFVRGFTMIGLRPKVPAHVIPRLVMATLDGLALLNLFDPPGQADEKEILRALEVFAFALFEL